MRITDLQKTAIIEAVEIVDPNARVWLFGSRTDDTKKGGDIDIAILSEIIGDEIMQQIQVRRTICNKIGEQRIDIVASADGTEAIFQLAITEGIRLK